LVAGFFDSCVKFGCSPGDGRRAVRCNASFFGLPGKFRVVPQNFTTRSAAYVGVRPVGVIQYLWPKLAPPPCTNGSRFLHESPPPFDRLLLPPLRKRRGPPSTLGIFSSLPVSFPTIRVCHGIFESPLHSPLSRRLVISPSSPESSFSFGKQIAVFFSCPCRNDV